ncbi:dTMP kinase [[Mycoplasma] collis]|uniref:dTMP kinase n=1 Tax=[Mycoplasma] collis TaxID=2127 RepID=UPI00051BF778|nr:dTMP kinase [[Mycoplasma] collis]
MFISFEGLDGCGKSTIIDKLKTFLPSYFPKKEFIFTREPGGENLKEAEKIREILLDKNNNIDFFSEAILFSAARRMHIEKVIWPALKNNKIVICDRFVHSSIAYQGAGNNIGVEKIKKLNDLVIEKTYPDFTFLLKIPADLSKKRISQQRNEMDRIEKNNLDFFTRVSDCYDQLADENKEKFIVVDGDDTIENVFEKVKEYFIKIIEK